MTHHDRTIGVGMVGYAFMGQAHSQGWRTTGRAFDLPLQPRMTAICGRNAEAVAAAATRFGWESSETDWRALVARDDIGIVDICTPGSSHAEIAIGALEAGKSVICEKPLANTVEEARAMVEAAAAAAPSGARAMVAFNYRRVPAVAFARKLIADGRLGEIRHVRANYLQDWLLDPEFPLEWRLRAEVAGSGALGDLGAHIIDLVQFLTGDTVDSVLGLTETFIKERPLPAGAGGGLSGGGASSERGEVTVDDAALFLGRMSGGAVASFEATRFATGRKNALTVEINGSKGSVVFDLERLNELQLLDADDPAAEQGFRRVLITESDHPYMEAWWPPGHIIGWEHTFSHEFADFIRALDAGEDPRPSFADGLQVQQVLDAVVRSASGGSWEKVATG